MLPDLSQLLSFSPTAQGGISSLFGGQAGALGGLFGLGNQGDGDLFGGILSSVLGEAGLDGIGNLGETLGAASTQEGESVDGENADVEAVFVQITQIITIVYEEFTTLSSGGIDLDNLNSVESLSAAYQELGLSPEEANSRAARLTLMFMLLDNRISTADLIGSLDGQGLNIGVKQQRAFIQVEQTIQAFSVASVGSQGQLSDLLSQGQSLLGGLTDQELAAALASAQNGEGIGSADGLDIAASKDAKGLLDNGLLGRVSEIFDRIAQKAAQLPEGKQLAAQLQEIATATKNIARQVLQDGGIGNLKQQALQVPTVDAGSQQAVAAQIKKDQDLPLGATAAADVAEGITGSDELNLGSRTEGHSRAHRSTDLGQGLGAASQKPAALAEPAVANYVVRASANGGVEVVDPKTGQVVQASSVLTPTAQNAGQATPEAALAQSRGLDIAAQARLSQQVRVHVRTLAAHNGGQIVVGLNPKELGRVQVRLEIHEGTVKGAITVQRPDVAESIAKDMQALQDALRDVGLEMSQDGIAIQLENHAAGSNGQEKEAHNQSGTAFANTSNEALAGVSEDGETAGRWMNPDRLLDVEA